MSREFERRFQLKEVAPDLEVHYCTSSNFTKKKMSAGNTAAVTKDVAHPDSDGATSKTWQVTLENLPWHLNQGMAPLSAYLFRLKPGYRLGTSRPKTMSRQLFRRDSKGALSQSLGEGEEEEVQATIGATTEASKMLSIAEESEDAEEKSGASRPASPATQTSPLQSSSSPSKHTSKPQRSSLSERRGKKGVEWSNV